MGFDIDSQRGRYAELVTISSYPASLRRITVFFLLLLILLFFILLKCFTLQNKAYNRLNKAKDNT